MDNIKPMRLQKFLSEAGVCSRRKGEELILSGQVSVNGAVVTMLGTKVCPGADEVRVSGEIVGVEGKQLFLFHKPSKVVTTLFDPQNRPCVGDYVRKLPVRVFPVGRLDWDVAGLLLLTNDGDFAQKLTHPSNEAIRVYWAMVKGHPDKGALGKLREGVELDDGWGKAVNAKTIRASKQTHSLFGRLDDGSSLVELSVSVGRNHFVKNILEVVGHPVESLCRVAFGPYELGTLRPGEMRKTKFCA